MTTINILCCYYVHGLDGSNRDFKRMKEKVESLFSSLFTSDNSQNKNVINVHYGYCSNDNAFWKTHFHFDNLVEKSFNELTRFMEEQALASFQKDYEEKYQKLGGDIQCNLYFSLIGHSLGGIISRDVAYRIFSSYEKDNVTYDSYFDYLKQKFTFLTAIKPCSFMTLSSPHMGSLARNESGGIIKTGEKTAVRMYCNWLSGSIGKLFTYKDAKPGKKPSLIRLSQNEYMECFGRFPNRTIVGCVRFDIPVKFCSAMGDIHHPVNEYADDHILVEDDTRICSFAGYEGEDLEYYKKEIFNETVSKKMYYPDTKHLPSPDIDEEIKVGLEKIKKTVEDGQKYEEMEDVCIPDTINQVEVPVSVLKLFNQISFRRIIIDFSLPMLYKMGTHYMYIGLVIGPSSSTVEAMIDKTVSLFSNIILADFIRTSGQTAEYSISEFYEKKEEEKEKK